MCVQVDKKGDLAWDVRWAKVKRKLYDSIAAIFQNVLKHIEGTIICLILVHGELYGRLPQHVRPAVDQSCGGLLFQVDGSISRSFAFVNWKILSSSIFGIFKIYIFAL